YFTAHDDLNSMLSYSCVRVRRIIRVRIRCRLPCCVVHKVLVDLHFLRLFLNQYYCSRSRKLKPYYLISSPGLAELGLKVLILGKEGPLRVPRGCPPYKFRIYSCRIVQFSNKLLVLFLTAVPHEQAYAPPPPSWDPCLFTDEWQVQYTPTRTPTYKQVERMCKRVNYEDMMFIVEAIGNVPTSEAEAKHAIKKKELRTIRKKPG
ncbi:Hypothetical predicted protein, partial [Paramuricea clavata]